MTHRITIVGGGAGGLPLATALAEAHLRAGRAEVTLVDPSAMHVWKPLLHEVAAGRVGAQEGDVSYAAIARRHGFRFVRGAMTGLDRRARAVVVRRSQERPGAATSTVEVGYDTLIVCVGSETNDWGVPGVRERAVMLDTPAQAERFRRDLLISSVRADARRGASGTGGVEVVIVGAGATGVELAAEIRKTTRAQAAYAFDRYDAERDIRLTLIEATPRILPLLAPRIAESVTPLLASLAIDVRTGERVVEVAPDGVRTARGGFFTADFVVWAAGIRAPGWLAHADGLQTDRVNRLVVGLTLQTTRDPDVFAFGDCAACPWPESGEDALLPPRAQVARQQATMLVETISARLDGRTLPRFRYRSFGSLATLGELSGAGGWMSRLVGGSLILQRLTARWTFALLHLMHQVSIHGAAHVLRDTLARLARGGDEARVKLH
ncbi:MAG: FAD-dependent oxidoreductase [Burkholderiales bacterium]